MRKSYYLLLIISILIVISSYNVLGITIERYSNKICYQESANVSTGCGEINTGTYSLNSLWNDANWSTPDTCSAGCFNQNYFVRYVNYTISSNIITANITFKLNQTVADTYFYVYCYNYSINSYTQLFTSQAGSSPGTFNISVPPVCLNNKLQLQYVMVAFGGNTQLYEEAVYWNITNNITINYFFSNSSSFINEPLTLSLNTSLNTSIFNSNISQAILVYNGTNHGVISYSDVGNTRIFSHTLTPNVTGNISYYWNITVLQGNGEVFNFTLNGSIMVNPLNFTINLFDENTGLSISSFNTSVLLQNIDTNQQFTLNNNVSQFNFTNLSSGSYYISITPSNTSYYNRVYNIVINSSNPTSMNAYIGVGSQVVLSYSDVDSGDALEGVLVTMYRTINSSIVSVESRYTDITGRVQFTYTSNIAYDFFSVKQGYNSLTYPLNPVLFASYNIKMTKTDTLPSGYDDVNVYYYPQSFDCDNMYNFVWSILSHEQLTGYAFAFTNVTFIGNTPSGQTVVNPINISCAGGMQWVTLYYNYTTDNNVSRQFSKTFFISGTKPATSYTFANNKVNDYGMGWFERLVVITIIVICVTGVASLLVGGVGGLVVGLLTLGYFANIFIVNKFIIAFTVIIGVLIIISRLKEQ